MIIPADPLSRYDIVRCGDYQYGNVLMEWLAFHHFRMNPDCAFVEVWEHGGWMLGWRRNGTIWNTANNTAVLPEGEIPYRFSGRQASYEVMRIRQFEERRPEWSKISNPDAKRAPLRIAQ